MKINSYWFWQVPENLKGPIVVLDSYSMTTNLPLLLSQKPRCLLIVNETNFSKAQQIYPRSLLIGESSRYPLSFFQATFPSEIASQNFKNQTLLYMTLNGSRVFEKYYQANRQLIGCAFNNLTAIANYLKNQKEITFIKSGDEGRPTPEDEICASFLQKELTGQSSDWQSEKNNLTKIIQASYGHPVLRDQSLAFVLAKDFYQIIPVCQKNSQGFLEIKSA